MNRRANDALITSLLVFCFAGCRDDNTRSSDQPEGSFCDAYGQVAADVGCAAKQDCAGFTMECDSLARRWLSCVRKDLTQCICESDGKMNCEGSFKKNEGPALCIDEYVPLDACLDGSDQAEAY